MTARVSAPRGSPDRPAVVAASERNHDQAHLLSLVRRIATRDRHAFGELHDRLSTRVRTQLLAAPSDPADAAAVAAGVFVEVWWLAHFHDGADADVLAWIDNIAKRRAADRAAARDVVASPDPGTPARRWNVLDNGYDRQTELTLAALLAPPPAWSGFSLDR